MAEETALERRLAVLERLRDADALSPTDDPVVAERRARVRLEALRELLSIEDELAEAGRLNGSS